MSTPGEPLQPLAALHTLAAYFESLRHAGKTRIWMSEDARTALREICRMKPGLNRLPAPGRPAAVPAPPAAAKRETAAPPPSPAPAPAGPSRIEPLPPLTETQLPARAAPLSRREQLDAIARRAELAPAARALGTLRDTMVFATGNPEASIMFIGEAPGADEEKHREPFVGVAGQLLTKVIKAMGLSRDDVYITNICKFRPALNNGRPQGTANRPPTAAEMQSCMEYILGEIDIIQPQVIVALGKTAAEGLLQREVAVTRMRGQWLDCRDIPLMITFHPSYLKRKEDEDESAGLVEKRKHWEDMLMVMERTGMPVSEKQRRYFLTRR